MNEFCYPGWTKKAITFSIDDGNVPLDAKFMAITKPAGIKGTFNLSTPLGWLPTAEEYREFYRGYEIANHCRYHAYPISEDRPVTLKGELFDPLAADRAFGYLTEEEGLYRIYTYDWTYMADDEKYMALVRDASSELENVFGRVRGYVWPCGEQKNPAVFEMLKQEGFQSIRAAGCTGAANAFDLPRDRARWSYNANHTNLCELAEQYDALPDDGKLKFFCFGVHAHDFERGNCWNVLEEFSRRFGNRPKDFWYACVGDIFDYEDAVKAVYEREGKFVNPSALPVYMKMDGRETVLLPEGKA